MKVLEISIKTKEGSRINLKKALLIKGKGIDGDKNAKGGERQISLLPQAVREIIDNEKIQGLCIKRYRENITYSGEYLTKGRTYKIGDSEIQISKENKRCFPECINIIQNTPCPLVESASFAKITKTGTVGLNVLIEPLEREKDFIVKKIIK